jgi:prolyl oligopeptidase
VDVYHGTEVPDPYRWLEDPDATPSRVWIEAQNAVTSGFLANIPQRQRIQERLTTLWNYERYGVPFRRGQRYFLTRNDGLQNQSVLYTMTSLDAEPGVLLDPNQLSPDGTTALAAVAASDDGRLLAYGLSAAGSDWQEWRVRDVETGRDLPDVVQWVKSSRTSWSKDGRGFFYSRFDAPDAAERLRTTNTNHKVYYHRLGEPQSADRLVYHRPDQPQWFLHAEVTDDGRYLVIRAARGTDPQSRLFYLDLSDPAAQVTELTREFDALYDFVGNDGSVFWCLTDRDAPQRRLVAIDLRRPEPSAWRELIPAQRDTLTQVTVVDDEFIALYLKDARSFVRVFKLDGQVARDLPLPGIGTASGFDGRRGDTETFFMFTGFTVAGTVYRYDCARREAIAFREHQPAFDPERFETRQMFYTGKDGTRIPMFVTQAKNVKLDGRNPVLLYGYGGFRISITPSFSPNVIAWLEMGGVYAVANIRGGGEYGQAWHQAGVKLRKQTVFDDFIAAGEWLVANRYTEPSRLAIIGASNGGLLVAACMTQRPDLFGAVLPAVGVLDMLRFTRFTVGWAWTSDYGSPEDAAEFQALMSYSPLHNLRPGTRYPATLITTADHDDRVVPAHSFKFAARLQECQAGPAPVLIRIDTKAGHGAGKPTTKIIQETADRYAFLIRALGMRRLPPPYD